uniref:Ionotropic glutamate receptor L-glutamate and glycine-binding domain-containing protein n=1 Tax=Timema monikensis TaxID=170555 RepID=A0A7R9E5J8_9NEOP|nr:unnamed protein product [Timema monikensis]
MEAEREIMMQNKLWNVLEKSLSDKLVPVTVLHVEDFDHSLLRLQCIHRKLVYVLLSMGINDKNSFPKLNNFKKVLSNPDLRGSTWVTFQEPTVKLDELFGDLPLPFNYEFLVASPSPGDLIVLKEVYRVEHSFPLTVSGFGSWGRDVGFLGPKNSLYERRNDFQGLLFRTANLNPPPAGEKVMNQLKVDGYFNKVLYVLEGRLNFTLSIMVRSEIKSRTEHKVPEDRAYGSVDRNGTWNGMVGMLVRGEVDLVVGTLTMTSQRLDAVRFSVPLVSSTFRLFIRQPENYSLQWGNFLAPFSCALWLLRVVFAVVFATLFTILHKLGQRYGSPEVEGPKLTLYEVAFYTYGAFFCSQST